MELSRWWPIIKAKFLRHIVALLDLDHSTQGGVAKILLLKGRQCQWCVPSHTRCIYTTGRVYCHATFVNVLHIFVL